MPDPNFNVPSPADTLATLFSQPGAVPPAFPVQWTATALLTPFGGLTASAPLTSSDELIAATVSYQASESSNMLRTRLYLLESQLFYDFAFVTSAGRTVWYWIISDPSDPSPSAPSALLFGPFSTSATVPAPTFLAERGFAYTGTWNVVNQSCDGYSASPGGKAAATWFSYLTGTDTLSRIMNVDNTNDFQLPVLGAYYLVNFPTFTTDAQGTSALHESLTAKISPPAAGYSSMLQQQDIQSAMANPPPGVNQVSCTAQDIAAIIPGLSVPAIQPAPPAWTDQMQSNCYMMGQDTYPYYCQVYYDYIVNQSQTSVFVQTDTSLGPAPYNARTDMVLPLGQTRPALSYTWNATALEWEPVCYAPTGGDVPMPVPNFVQMADGRCRAAIAGNPYFGDDDVITIWSVMLAGATGWSDFWYWFNSEQQGIVFSLAPASSLTMIDYQTFIQNPTFPAGTFIEPEAGLPSCSSNAAAKRQSVMFVPKGGYG